MVDQGQSKAAGRVLLPDAVLPLRYEIRLTPDLDRFVFDGSQRVFVEVHEATNEVTLHAKELSFSSAKFIPQGENGEEGEALEVETILTDLKATTVKFGFPEVLPVGKGILCIEFAGVHNNQMAGFYRSGYKDIDGTEKTMVSTQFESLDARRCFPCWDEPARKAVFALTLLVDPSLKAISNMPEKSSRTLKVGKKQFREQMFMDTPLMSTYLVAIVVGEFDEVQACTQHGVLVRVLTPPGRAQAGAFALSVATKALDIYDDFFGLHYPLPKLDMVAIPEFAMGAMENWGLVTYREVDLLIDEKTASSTQKQRVCIVVTHELAHQWFGNLVTMAWWDDLWLNEGFASWCENYVADLIFPDYQMWEQFPSDTLAAALRLDALKTSHPIQVPIAHAEEVEEVFDSISYCKGASVIRMAHAVLGHDAFQKGLQAYMKQHQYSNTETFQLWAAWAESSGKPVKEIMSSWTEQMGYPLVEVTSFAVKDGRASIGLRQSWFLASGEVAEERCWTTPLFIKTHQGQQTMIMMSTATQDISLEWQGAASDGFLLINEGARTPMRVAYSSELRELLVKAIKAGQIGVVDRASLIMDAFALTKANRLPADALMQILAGFFGEKDYIVWDALAAVLLSFAKILMGGGAATSEVYQKYVAFAERFVWKGWEAAGLGFDTSASDGHTSSLLRGLLVKLVSKFAPAPSFLAEARKRFKTYVEDPKENAMQLPDEYRVSVLQAVLKNGSEAEYRQLIETFPKLTSNVEQTHIFHASGYALQESLKVQSLNWAIRGEVKIQDFFMIFGSVSSSSSDGLELMWKFLQSNFDLIYGMVKTASPSIMDAVIRTCAAGFASEAKASEIEAFFKDHPLPQNKRTIAQVLEEMRSNAKFLDIVMLSGLTKPEVWEKLLA